MVFARWAYSPVADIGHNYLSTTSASLKIARVGSRNLQEKWNCPPWTALRRTSMANKQALKLLFVAAIISIGFSTVPALAGVTPGTWVGAAEFGTFDAVVNAQGTGVERITYNFSSFTCGSSTVSGGIGIIPGTPWPISNNEFSISNTLDPNRSMTVSGSFDPDSPTVGTWEAVFNGVVCTGTWIWETDLASDVPPVTIDHAFVQGVFWNPDVLPGWGFFVDVQEDTMFGAVYGYLGSDSTFITLQGTQSSADPLIYQGDVFFVSNGGSSVSDVGNFTWSVGEFEASPAAILTITSNILNATDLGLVRFSYAEKDKVDMLTGGDWNIVRRISGVTFGDYYAITDTRVVEDGITFAGVIDNSDPENTGTVGYMELDVGSAYVMLVEFDSDTFVFYGIYASNTDMYGRYWLLDPDEEPTGDGFHFRAAVDTLQAVESSGAGGGGVTSKSGDTPRPDSRSESGTNAAMLTARKDLEKLEYDNAKENLDPLFSEAAIKSAFEKVVRANQSINR